MRALYRSVKISVIKRNLTFELKVYTKVFGVPVLNRREIEVAKAETTSISNSMKSNGKNVFL